MNEGRIKSKNVRQCRTHYVKANVIVPAIRMQLKYIRITVQYKQSVNIKFY